MIDPRSDRAKYHQVADGIRRQIRGDELKPGDMLPSEKNLGELWGVGRDTIRDALNVLRGEGLVVTIRGKGTFVREPKPLVTVTLNQGDHMRCRMPYPEERDALDIGEGIPVLVVTRADGSEESYAGDCTRIAPA